MIELILIALFFSIHQILIKKGVNYADANYGAFVSLATTTVIFCILSLNRIVLNLKFIAFMILSGILHFLIARTAFYNAISRIGANAAGSLAATRIFFAIMIGAFLGEKIGLNVLLMAIFIFIGIHLISSPKGAKDAKGVFLAIFTGFITALSSGIVKRGMEIYPDAIYGSAIGYLSSFIFYPMIFKWKNKGGEKFFIPAGVFVGLGHYLRYHALISYPVSVVEPFLSIYPLFTLILTLFVFRSVENVSRNVIIGSLLIVLGIESYFLV